MSVSPGSQLVTASPVTSVCSVCGERIGASSAWVIGYPKLAHTACVDWTSRPFPFAWRLSVLEGMVHRLRENREATRVVERLLYVHQRAAMKWPVPAAIILDTCSAEGLKARNALSALGVERRLLERF